MVKEDREAWSQCVEWLMSTGILEFNGFQARASKPADAMKIGQNLADLAALLRDGILLCELLLKLSPGCIDRKEIFILNRKSPFMCSKNISLFLTTCQQHFGLSEVFNYCDLYDLEDFGRVIKVLSLLSHTHQARQLNLRPFTVFSPANGNDGARNDSDVIYCNLREQVEELAASAEELQYDFIGNYPTSEGEKKQEELYDSILTQRVPKLRIVSPKYAEFKPTNERGFCIKELLDTESNYVDALSMIIDTFCNKLKFKLTTEDHNTIFMNIESIYNVHKKFLNKLAPAALRALGIEDSSCVDEKGNNTIADVFLRCKLEFIIYGRYCAYLKSSLGKLEELERMQPETKRIINDMSKFTSNSQFKLQDLLVVPMQRILKYTLLLKQLMKTSTDIYEQTVLHNAIEAMNDVSNYINEYKRDHEAMEVIDRLQRSVTMHDGSQPGGFSDYGRLIEDGCVKLSEEGVRSKQRYIFLFEKLIMICKQQKSGMYDFKRVHFLSDLELVVENEPEVTNKTNTLSRKLTASFFDNTVISLIRKGFKSESSASFSLQLQFKSVKQRDYWREKIKKAMEINLPAMSIAKGHTLLYKNYNCALSCAFCEKLLPGKVYQGYHCSGNSFSLKTFQHDTDFYKSFLGCNKDMCVTCCRMQNCSRRPCAFSRTKMNSASSIQVPQFYPGELVVSRQSVTSMDSTRLSYHNGDLIEVVEVNQDGTILGRLSSLPNRTGIISVDCIAKTSETLQKSMSDRNSANRSSAGSLSFPSESNGEQPLSLSIHQNGNSLVSTEIIKYSEEKDLEIHQQPWFFGELGREQANQLLETTEPGTFILRHSMQQHQFVISLRYDGRGKHMKIEYCDENRKYYLHDGRMFETIIELVNYYRINNLSEGFNNLDVMLKGTPLKGTIYKALHLFERRDPQGKYLTLQPGDIVTVLDTGGEAKGWWKGKISGPNSIERTGFFPISYVARVEPNVAESYTLSSDGRVRQTQHLLMASPPSEEAEATL